MLSTILLIISGLALLITTIIMVANAFRESIVWGLVSFFIPFALYVYAIKFWVKNKIVFLVHWGSFALAVAGLVLQFMYPLGF